MFTYILYVLAAIALALSFFKDRKKTKQALIKAWKSFENILPQFLSILLIIGLALAILSPETITKLIGADSGVWGVLAASLIGSITLIPGFVAFPLAAALLKSGAGYMQSAAFVSTLMMVGIVTLPLERRFFGTRVAVARNALSLIGALVIGLTMASVWSLL